MTEKQSGTPQSIKEAARKHVLFPETSKEQLERSGPVIMASGQGMRLKDVDGKNYLDGGSSGVYCVMVGYGRERIADVMRDQAATLMFYQPFGFGNIPSTQLAQKLAELAPGALSTTFFTCEGSTAVETAFKLVRQYWYYQGYQRRYKIISRRGAYHGSTMGAGAATGCMPPIRQIMEPLPPGYYHALAPYCYRCDVGLEYPNCDLQCAASVEQIIQFEGPDQVAAFIGEFVQATGGVFVPPPEYWPKIRQICDKYGLFMIDDEVICGFGRTGRWFGIEHTGVVGDVMTMGKGISSGYVPLSATITRPDIVDGLPSFVHVHTYNNHPVSCAAGLENVKIIEEENLVQNAAEMGDYLLGQLKGLAKDHASIGDVRGIGLLAAIEFVKDRKTKEHFGPEINFCGRVSAKLMEKGILLRGLDANQLEFMPPLIVTRPDLDEILREVDRAIALTEAEVRNLV